ncbi:hypothetical protein [Arthrobacter psychrolactophilus]
MTVPPIPPAESFNGSEATQPANPETPVPAASMTRKSKKHVYFGLGGVVAGLGVGLVAGLLIAGSLAAQEDAKAQAEADAAAVASAQALATALPSAAEKCSGDSTTGIEVMDQGQSLSMNTSGKKSSGTAIVNVVCVLKALDAPDVLFSKLDSTRALDGTQSTEWAGYTASWTLPPR